MITLVRTRLFILQNPTDFGAEYKEAFALFDKKGTGAVPRETLGDLLRALGQNPTQAEVAEIISSAPRDGTLLARCTDGRSDSLIYYP